MDQKKTKLTPALAILEEAFKIWWKNLKQIVRVYLWGILFTLLPLAAVFLFYFLALWLGADSNISLRVVIMIISIAGFLAAIYFSIRTHASFFLLLKKDYQGEPLKIFKETKSFFWSYFGLSVLTAVLVLLWTLLLIIPGIIYSIFYSFAAFALFFEGLRGMAAIRRSRDLVRNYFWPVAGRLFFIGILIWIFSVIFAIPLNFLTENTWPYYCWNILFQIINFLIGPIILIFMYRVYQDLVAIKKS